MVREQWFLVLDQLAELQHKIQPLEAYQDYQVLMAYSKYADMIKMWPYMMDDPRRKAGGSAPYLQPATTNDASSTVMQSQTTSETSNAITGGRDNKKDGEDDTDMNKANEVEDQKDKAKDSEDAEMADDVEDRGGQDNVNDEGDQMDEAKDSDNGVKADDAEERGGQDNVNDEEDQKCPPQCPRPKVFVNKELVDLEFTSQFYDQEFHVSKPIPFTTSYALGWHEQSFKSDKYGEEVLKGLVKQALNHIADYTKTLFPRWLKITLIPRKFDWRTDLLPTDVIMGVMVASDGSCSHAITVHGGFIFDANEHVALPLCPEALDYCTSTAYIKTTFVDFKRAWLYRYRGKQTNRIARMTLTYILIHVNLDGHSSRGSVSRIFVSSVVIHMTKQGLKTEEGLTM